MCKALRPSSKQRMFLEFSIGKYVVEFGHVDFALISGLNMCGPKETPSTSDFESDVFCGCGKVNFKDIKKNFLDECKKDLESHVAQQLTYLDVVYGAILMDGMLNTNLPVEFMHLIDNLEHFKAFA